MSSPSSLHTQLWEPGKWGLISTSSWLLIFVTSFHFLSEPSHQHKHVIIHSDCRAPPGQAKLSKKKNQFWNNLSLPTDLSEFTILQPRLCCRWPGQGSQCLSAPSQGPIRMTQGPAHTTSDWELLSITALYGPTAYTPTILEISSTDKELKSFPFCWWMSWKYRMRCVPLYWSMYLLKYWMLLK